jgi:hypothetical protein
MLQSTLQWLDSRRQQCSESTYKCCSEEEVSNINTASSELLHVHSEKGSSEVQWNGDEGYERGS